MASGFPGKVAELERALALVEGSLQGAELQRARALTAALLDVHRAALEDLQRIVGEAALLRAAAAEPSVAWILACHELSAAPLAEAEALAVEKQARSDAKAAPTSSAFVPIARLVRREGKSA